MPVTERQAKAYPDAPYWHAAESVEKVSLLETGTFSYMGREDLPGGCNVVRTKIVYDVKTNPDGSIDILLKSSSGEFPELVVSTETFLVTRSLYTKQASGFKQKQL